jgi:hypothetical protein
MAASRMIDDSNKSNFTASPIGTVTTMTQKNLARPIFVRQEVLLLVLYLLKKGSGGARQDLTSDLLPHFPERKFDKGACV